MHQEATRADECHPDQSEEHATPWNAQYSCSPRLDEASTLARWSGSDANGSHGQRHIEPARDRVGGSDQQRLRRAPALLRIAKRASEIERGVAQQSDAQCDQAELPERLPLDEYHRLMGAAWPLRHTRCDGCGNRTDGDVDHAARGIADTRGPSEP